MGVVVLVDDLPRGAGDRDPEGPGVREIRSRPRGGRGKPGEVDGQRAHPPLPEELLAGAQGQQGCGQAREEEEAPEARQAGIDGDLERVRTELGARPCVGIVAEVRPEVGQEAAQQSAASAGPVRRGREGGFHRAGKGLMFNVRRKMEKESTHPCKNRIFNKKCCGIFPVYPSPKRLIKIELQSGVSVDGSSFGCW